MITDLTVFDYMGSQVRTSVRDGDIWFVAKDVCEVLEITNSRDAVGRLDHDEKDVALTDTLGGKQTLTYVSEAGLYALVLGSRKSEAKEFKRWITHIVIPSIRKKGSYSIQQPQSIEDLIILQAQSMKELRSKVDTALSEIQVHKHRLDTIDSVDVIGDPQQRLGAMVKKYCHANGVTFRKGWQDFRNAYNTAYHTNLTARIDHYKEKHHIKELTMPQFLSMVGEIEDAIRVADKMLNPVGV